MIKNAQIEALSRLIAERFRPERIVLFGSRASGRPHRDSDVDLLVVLPFRGHSARKAAEILNSVQPDFPVDLIVRTPAELRKRLDLEDAFLSDIMQRGKVLYEAAHA